jgi:hypothetical protein
MTIASSCIINTSLFVLVIIICSYVPFVYSQDTAATEAPVNPSKCDLKKWNDYLVQESAHRSCALFSRCADYGDLDKNGKPTGGTICSSKADCEPLGLETDECKVRKLALTNERHIFEFEKCCRDDMKNLKTGKFGPPRRYQKHGVACSGTCAKYDFLAFTKRKTVSKCSCEEVGYCKKSSMFWLCKELWECWGEGDDDYSRVEGGYFKNFCQSCGSSYSGVDEEIFYEEMDCGPGAILHKSTHTASIVLAGIAFLYNLFNS